jgi:uncharacterized MnhB-related membrane protein
MRRQELIVLLTLLCLRSTGLRAQASEGNAGSKDTSGKSEPATLVGHCEDGRYYTYVLADGGLSTTGKDKNSTPSSGSIGFRHLASHEEFRANIGLKSTSDTLHGTDAHDFAASLLAPAMVGGTGSVDFLYRRFVCKARTDQQFGFKLRLGALRTIWAFDTLNTDKKGQSVEFASPVTIINAAVLGSAVWINQSDSAGNLIAFGADAGPVARWYLGERSDVAFTEATLGTTSTRFWGALLSAWSRFHNLTVVADFPILRPGKGRQPTWSRAPGPSVTFNLEAPLYKITNYRPPPSSAEKE